MITTMKPHIDASLTFTVPLALEAHAQAQQFRGLVSNPQKAKQVYLNTLAVYAVNFYLQCQGLETEWEKSDSANPVMQTLLNIADLQIKNLGKLECIPVLPNSEVCYIPPEVWQERIGYVAVQFNESLREATLLGFVEKVTTSKLPISSFKSLDQLSNIYPSNQQKPVAELVHLGQWFNNVFDAGWQTLEEIFNPPKNVFDKGLDTPEYNIFDEGLQTLKEIFNPPKFSFRSALSTVETGSENPEFEVQRAKLLHLERVDEQVVLSVALKFNSSSEIQILVRLYPANVKVLLPEDLQLIVLDKAGRLVMQAEARSTRSIILKFTGEAGEKFGIKVALGDASITENFLI